MGCLRLYLALSVLIAHTGPLFGTTLAGGPPAVQAFFVISGFYMALVLHEKYRGDRAGTLTFWLNRLLRLGPLYLLVLGAMLVVTWRHRGASPFFDTLGRLSGPWQAFVWAANVGGVGLDALLFIAIDPATGAVRFAPRADYAGPLSPTNLMLVGQGWTLSLEAYFYLLAPWLVRLRWRWVMAIMGLSFGCRVALAKGMGWQVDPFYYRFFPNELATFLLGVLAYYGYRRLGRDHAGARRFGWWALAGVLVAAPVWFRLPVPAKSIGFAVIVAGATPLLFSASRTARWDRWVGELSYPVYLMHGLAMLTLGPARHGPVAVLMISLTMAAAVVLGVERPTERVRQQLARRAAKTDSRLTAAGPFPTAE